MKLWFPHHVWDQMFDRDKVRVQLEKILHHALFHPCARTPVQTRRLDSCDVQILTTVLARRPRGHHDLPVYLLTRLSQPLIESTKRSRSKPGRYGWMSPMGQRSVCFVVGNTYRVLIIIMRQPSPVSPRRSSCDLHLSSVKCGSQIRRRSFATTPHALPATAQSSTCCKEAQETAYPQSLVAMVYI